MTYFKIPIFASPKSNGDLKIVKCGSSSVGRASAFQAECREFDPRLPLERATKNPYQTIRIFLFHSIGYIQDKFALVSKFLSLDFLKIFRGSCFISKNNKLYNVS